MVGCQNKHRHAIRNHLNQPISPARHRFLTDNRQPVTDNWFVGGADRDRTGDPLVANQVLSQLSYSPLEAVAGRQLSVVGISDN